MIQIHRIILDILFTDFCTLGSSHATGLGSAPYPTTYITYYATLVMSLHWLSTDASLFNRIYGTQRHIKFL